MNQSKLRKVAQEAIIPPGNLMRVICALLPGDDLRSYNQVVQDSDVPREEIELLGRTKYFITQKRAGDDFIALNYDALRELC